MKSLEAWEESTEQVLVCFGASWCAPWKLMQGFLDKMQKEGLLIEKIDIDEKTDLADKWLVVSLPTLIILENGEEKRRYLGSVSENELVAALTLQSNKAKSGMRRRR